MYQYGKKSKEVLETVDPDIVRVFIKALELGLIDISIIEGIRSQEKQDEYFRIGKSRVQWPNGKHNIEDPDDKAEAVDAAPYVNGDVSWIKAHCIYLAGIVLAIAEIEGVKIRWGGNWDMDGEPITDQDFQDLVHYEKIN